MKRLARNCARRRDKNISMPIHYYRRELPYDGPCADRNHSNFVETKQNKVTYKRM